MKTSEARRFRARAIVAALVWCLLHDFSPWTRVRAQEAAPEVLAYADIVLYNGKVLTADDNFTRAEGVAIRDGGFLAVGATSKILTMAGPRTRKIDLKGKTVVPGFIDSHQHLHDYAMRGADLHPTVNFRDLDQGLKELGKIAEATPAGQWIIVSARAAPYSLGNILIKQMLDQVSSQHPIAVNYDNSGYTVNSVALQKIPSDMPGMTKDARGEPTGQLVGRAGGVLTYELLPWTPIETFIPLFKREMLRENAAGLTTVCTRVPGNELTAIKELWARGELTMRWRVNHEFLMYNHQGEAYLKRIGNLDGFGDDMLKISGLHLGPPDSIFGNGGAWTWKPKLRQLPGSAAGPHGMIRWGDPETSERKSVILAVRYGWSLLGQHSAGDRSNSELLSAYEEGLKKPLIRSSRQRLAIDHGPMLTPEHIAKMKELGVIPSLGMKYIFGTGTENVAYQYGADAVQKMTLTRSMIEAGLRPVLEADTGEAPLFHPLWQMEKVLTRKDEQGRVWGIEQKVTREQALWMYTNWAASYTGDEGKLGTIEAGKLADWVVIDGDYMAVPEDQISELPVVMTGVGGKIVFETQGKLN